jgi:beta-mannanase
MLKLKITLLALMAIGACSFAAQARADLGVYDPDRAFDKAAGIRYEQIWVDWSRDSAKSVLVQLQAITAKGRTPILSIDPNPIRKVGSAKSLLGDVAAGRYDKVTRAYAAAVKAVSSPVIVRWGPEMERDNNTPWSGKPAADYIAAYRHFATAFHVAAPGTPLVWSPLGREGSDTAPAGTVTSDSYYPGDEFVDFVGFSVYEYPKCTIQWYGVPRSFADWMQEKYPPLAKFGKPVIIVELGVFDSPANQEEWVKAAFSSLDQFPLVKIVIYYDAKDPVNWSKFVEGAVAPDWHINPTALTTASLPAATPTPATD